MANDFPKYSYTDEMASPRQLGIRRDGSFDSIMRAVGGMNYYSDSIGFGSPTGFAKMNNMTQRPMGIRFFTKTGMQCSNGADMYEYVDTVPKGNLLGKRVTEEMRAMGLPTMQGLAPGILEDATSALNPVPLIQAATGSGYARCKKVTLPVGDSYGNVRSSYDRANVWIKEPTKNIGQLPHQTRWVFDSWISMEDWDNEPKLYNRGDVPITEGFSNPLHSSQIAAGVLITLLAIGVAASIAKK